MKTLYIYQGIQGSGKSTRARQFVLEDPDNRIRVNRDEIRLMIGKALKLTKKRLNYLKKDISLL